MSNWEYIQSLLDIIDKQEGIIKHQVELLAMHGIDAEGEKALNLGWITEEEAEKLKE